MATEQTVSPNRFGEEFGYPKGAAVSKVKGHMTRYVQEFVRRAPFVIMATSNAEGVCDASPKGGKPGFVQVIDERHLLFPDVAGNKLFQSYQNMDNNPQIGLIFFIPGINETARVNGRVSFLDKDELDRRNIELSLYETDDNAKHVQGIVVEVVEAFAHCPRALKFSHLWDTEQIQANREQPLASKPWDSE